MAQLNTLLATLKKALKSHGLTYAKVAAHLSLTEASVKRLFAEQHLSLQRLEQICQLMDMEISDLVQLMNEQQPRLQQLTHEQEEQITQNLVLLLITVCLLNRWTLDDILNYYKITEHECIQQLANLDRLKVIELLPHNKIKLRVAPNFGWREGGPIQQFFQARIAEEFFKHKFEHENESLQVLNGMLSHEAHKELQRKLKRLAREFDELNNQDAQLPFAERHGVTLVLAARNWKYGLLQPLLRRAT
jgi:DNA-binding Xre family transcriptional regulator